ncbi:MAG: Smr/MutS family protein [Melioribacteraceae bacterium]|nr:Smr/MutS family protein [Melioribacteraceae bacterium]
MLICETCGNEIEKAMASCPFCGGSLSRKKSTNQISYLETINLKAGMPTVEEARERLKLKLDNARHRKLQAVKLIHGYGSTGKGGAIKIGIHSSLSKMKRDKFIKGFIPGEKFGSIYSESELFTRKNLFLKNDSDYNKKNEGITIVIF